MSRSLSAFITLGLIWSTLALILLWRTEFLSTKRLLIASIHLDGEVAYLEFKSFRKSWATTDFRTSFFAMAWSWVFVAILVSDVVSNRIGGHPHAVWRGDSWNLGGRKVSAPTVLLSPRTTPGAITLLWPNVTWSTAYTNDIIDTSITVKYK
jgi:hypothetical protein